MSLSSVGCSGTELPDKVVPLFMASKSQELFQCVCDEDVTVENPIKLVPKEDILNDMKTRAAVSDFHPVKQAMQVSRDAKKIPERRLGQWPYNAKSTLEYVKIAP